MNKREICLHIYFNMERNFPTIQKDVKFVKSYFKKNFQSKLMSCYQTIIYPNDKEMTDNQRDYLLKKVSKEILVTIMHLKANKGFIIRKYFI